MSLTLNSEQMLERYGLTESQLASHRRTYWQEGTHWYRTGDGERYCQEVIDDWMLIHTTGHVAQFDHSKQPHRDGFVYLIGAEDVGRVKIGHTKNLEDRLDALQTGSPIRLTLLGSFSGRQDAELAMHHRFAEFRLHGEWFVDCEEIRRAFE